MFDYPQHAHQRRHGPRGYNDYRSFKPWLRDEFAFRCVYCLWRETWSAAGDAAFSVEHLQSQSRQPELARDYTNLVYACCGCNSAKQDHDAPLDPCRDAWATHVSVGRDGVVTAMTGDGQRLIHLCLLNRPALVSARQTMFRLWSILNAESSAEALDLKHRLFGLPSDLPDLAKLRPVGNAIPSGVASSFFERRQRGELPVLFDAMEPALALRNTLREIWQRCQQPNWDDEGAEAISTETHEVALRLLDSLPSGTPLPTVSAEPDGQLNFEWYQAPRRLLSASISSNGTLNWAALIGSEDPRGSGQFVDQFPQTLLYWIGQVNG